jgi:hypothetical protein
MKKTNTTIIRVERLSLPGNEVEGQAHEGHYPQQVGPDVSCLRVNAKDGLETFPGGEQKMKLSDQI